jgi:hypothetical protein
MASNRKSSSHSPKPRIIALCGGKGHGKGTAADVLIRKYGFRQIEFADGLRKTVATALRCDPSWFTDPATKEEIDPRTGKARRFWLQWIGTEGFRSLYENTWVDWWSGEIGDCGTPAIVTTDLRFPNELEAVRRLGHNALVIRVSNPRLPVPTDTHESERHFGSFDVDYDLVNDRSIRELQYEVENVIWDHSHSWRKLLQERLATQ